MTITLKSGKEIVYRRLQKGDEALLKTFHNRLAEGSRNRFTPHAYDEKTIAKVVERSEKDSDRVYLAFDGNEVVAYFFLWWFDSEFPVLGIGITDAYQGQGLGKQIMDILIEDGRKAGCSGIELTTVVQNQKAYDLYKKVGFKSLGQVDNSAGDGLIVKEWHMLYELKPGVIPPARVHGPPV